MQIKSLEWDSNFFGINVGKVIIGNREIQNLTIDGKFDLIYFFVSPQDPKANEMLKKNKAILVDERVTYLKNVKAVYNDLGNISSYTSAGEEKDNQVISIGIQSGVYSRFRVDPNISEENFIKLYSLWLRKSIERSIAKEVFVSQFNGKINGVITVGEKSNMADIGIFAVDKNSRGQNIGKNLLQRVEAYCEANQYTTLQVVTQKANVTACKFYEKNGFSIGSVVNIYHWWKQK